ncbi:MAG: hypothetical protein U1E51_14825 [Candidatus Binatia bacterium]|nr:hypothetical protein [Candidatus Binatia bacterium]
MSQPQVNPPWFVRKDLDGFFGLMIDNLIQLILIVSLCRELIHLPDSYIFGKILPGAAVSILVGNFFYAWQARRLARETGREDVTALPYGINTVSLFAFVFFIMLPIVQETKDPVWAWKVGLVACFLSGVIEIIGAFIAETVRRVTPRAALLSALAGIAITFISMDFTFKIFAQPLVALAPMALIFVAYFSHQRLPLGLPGGMVAIAIGTGLGWILGTMNGKALNMSVVLAPPVFAGVSLWEALTHPAFLNYFSVIFPMGIFNVVGSLQNIESAEAAGDRYRTFPSLMANGIGSVVAALFGSVFPTTILHRPPRLEAPRRALGLLRAERNIHQFSLPHRDDPSSARVDSFRGGNRHSPVYRHHHRGAGVSGDAQGACAGGGVRHRSRVGSMGTPDG